jgi:phage gpG-like protein
MAGAAFTFSVSVDAKPWEGMIARLRAFPDQRLDAANDEIGEGLVSSTKQRFHAQHTPMGNPWKPSERAKRDRGETLIDKGMLIGSLTHNVLPRHGVEWGSNKIYARVHQEGADIIIPPRQATLTRKVESGKGASGKGWSGIVGGFVKASRGNFSQTVKIGGYTVHMPARPYLGIDQADNAMITATYTRHLAAALLGRSPGALQ